MEAEKGVKVEKRNLEKQIANAEVFVQLLPFEFLDQKFSLYWKGQNFEQFMPLLQRRGFYFKLKELNLSDSSIVHSDEVRRFLLSIESINFSNVLRQRNPAKARMPE